jgi:hypothetical protein
MTYFMHRGGQRQKTHKQWNFSPIKLCLNSTFLLGFFRMLTPVLLFIDLAAIKNIYEIL